MDWSRRARMCHCARCGSGACQRPGMWYNALPPEEQDPMKKQGTVPIVSHSARHYDRRGVLPELEEEPVEFTLAEDLRDDILHR